MVFEVETEREVWRRGQIRIGFVEEHCFQFRVKELWSNSKGCGFSPHKYYSVAMHCQSDVHIGYSVAYSS